MKSWFNWPFWHFGCENKHHDGEWWKMQVEMIYFPILSLGRLKLIMQHRWSWGGGCLAKQRRFAMSWCHVNVNLSITRLFFKSLATWLRARMGGDRKGILSQLFQARKRCLAKFTRHSVLQRVEEQTDVDGAMAPTIAWYMRCLIPVSMPGFGTVLWHGRTGTNM